MTDDLDRIMEVMEAAFDPAWGEAWNRRQVGDLLTLPHTHYLLLNADGMPPNDAEPAAGFILTRAAPGEEELLLVGVQPGARRSGIGTKLLQLFINQARTRGAQRVFLEMRCNNPAHHLYRGLGFRPVGRRKDYYKLHEGGRIDAITLALEL